VDARLDDGFCGYRGERAPRRPRDESARASLLSAAAGPVNFARFVFLDPRAKEFYADWERSARDCAALLRSEAGRNPFDRELSDLVGELSTRSEEFRGHWATHSVRLHDKGEKRFKHPVVGELELSYNRIELAADPGLTVVAYTAEPGSRSQEALSLLASWAATEEEHEADSGDASARGSMPSPPS
jgi:MmyB-like transcription regulator ligand binding domain